MNPKFSRRTSWPTAQNRLTARLESLRRQNATIFDLTESNPTRCGFIYDDEAMREALGGPEVASYDPHPRGLRQAREAIARYYEERGEPLPTDRIILTTGSSEAYSMVFRTLCDPGDEILAPVPSYPLFDYLADLDGVQLRKYPLEYDGEWRIDFEAVEAAINERTRGVLVVHPNNPTGSLLHPRDRTRLVRLAVRHNLAVVSDEVFLEYTWSGERAESFNSRGLCLTFLINGLSKMAALPQMKLGWIGVRGPVGPDADACARLEIIADTYLSVGSPVQRAAATLLGQRKLLEPQIRERLGDNLAFLDAQLGGDSPLSRLRAQAGWYVVLRAPASLSDEDWALFLLETAGVLAHPGHFFDFAQEGMLVLSLLPRPEIFREGVTRLVEAVR